MLPIHVDISKVFSLSEEKLHEFHTCRVSLKMNVDEKRKKNVDEKRKILSA